MSKKISQVKYAILLSLLVVSGCAVEAAKTPEGEKTSLKNAETANFSKGATIKIETNSPADTVRVFYKNLREKRFREALFLTNLRPAIEGLTDTELKELQVDFEDIASEVPAEIQITGEIISGDRATVTANLPDNETGKIALQEIKLRKAENFWMILTVDEEAEKLIKKEGKNYFFALRMETFQAEARKILEKISKQQMVFALQNGGNYANIGELIEKGFLPKEILSPDATGYVFDVKVSDNKKQYFATATPAVYGKTGKLSYLLELDTKNDLRLHEKDKNGQPLKK